MAGGSEKRNASQAMATRMKMEGVRRQTARCPVCTHVISIDPEQGRDLYGHIAYRCATGRGE